jgi:hypothetical protein
MGILARIKKKGRDLQELDRMNSRILHSFHNLRKDLNNQNKWISYLHDMNKNIQVMHQNLHLSPHDLNRSHDEHKKLTVDDISKIKKWINFLYTNQKKQNDDLLRIEAEFREAIEKYSEYILKLHKMIEEKQSPDESELLSKVQELLDKKRSDIDSELKKIEEKLENRLLDRIKDVVKADEPSLLPDNPKRSVDLTNPEQKLLNLLLNEPDPISYAQIAGKTGHSINTIRVVMNSLKKKNLVEEAMIPNGSKLFSAQNKEKIKKLYNLETI